MKTLIVLLEEKSIGRHSYFTAHYVKSAERNEIPWIMPELKTFVDAVKALENDRWRRLDPPATIDEIAIDGNFARMAFFHFNTDGNFDHVTVFEIKGGTF